MTKNRILYCGYMRTPYARTDAELLTQICKVRIINLSEITFRHSQILMYGIRFFTQILPGTIRSDITWVWSASYSILPIFITAKLFGRKTVVNIEGWEVHNDPVIGYGNQQDYVKGAISRWIMRHADVVVVQSPIYADRVKCIVPYARIGLLPGAITVPNTTIVKQAAVLTAYCRYKNSDRIKGIDTFLYAIVQLPYRYALLVDRSHETLIDRMKTAKVFCQLSYAEHFGITVLEAMAEGCIPVVSDRGNLPNLVGNAGVVVPYNDVEATIKGIRTAMTMDSNGARDQARYYSIERKIENLKKIIGMVS